MNGAGAIVVRRLWRVLARSAVLGLLALLAGCGGGGGGASTNTGGSAASYLRFAYVANSGNNTVSINSINPVSGQLRADGYALTGAQPQAALVDATGHYLYVPNKGSDNISAFRIDATTGQLTELAGSPFVTGTEPVSITEDGTGHFLYVVNTDTAAVSGSISVYSIDSATGKLSPIAGSPFATGNIPGTFAIEAGGRFAYVVDTGSGKISGYSVNTTTGKLTALAGSPFSQTDSYPAEALVADPSEGFLYVVTSLNRVYTLRVDPATGALSRVNFADTSSSQSSRIAVDPGGRYVYITDAASSSISGYRVNQTTGALTALATSPFPPDAVGSSPTGIKVDPSGHFVYVTDTTTNNTDVYRLDAGTGALTASSKMRARGTPLDIAFTTGPNPVAYKPTYLYAANSYANNLSAFRVDTTTGALTELTDSPFTTGTYPADVVVHPNGRFVYVANLSSSTISAFSVDAGTGKLNSISGSPFAESGGASGPKTLAIEPSGRFLYVGNGSLISVFQIDQTSGALTEIAHSPFATPSPGLGRIAVNPNGTCLYTTVPGQNMINVYTIDPASGDLAALVSTPASSPFTILHAAVDVNFGAGGQFIYISLNSNTASSVVSYALGADGALSISYQGLELSAYGPIGLDVDPTNSDLYVANAGQGVSAPGNNIAAFQLNAAAGTFAPITGSPYATGGLPETLRIDPSGQFVYTPNFNTADISAFRIDHTTGALTPLTGSPVTTRQSNGGTTSLAIGRRIE